MKESQYNADRKCIFRENFDSEQGVRSRGGIPVGVTFENGVASNFVRGSASNIKYQNKISTHVSSDFSIRLKVMPLSTTLWDNIAAIGGNYIGVTTINAPFMIGIAGNNLLNFGTYSWFAVNMNCPFDGKFHDVVITYNIISGYFKAYVDGEYKSQQNYGPYSLHLDNFGFFNWISPYTIPGAAASIELFEIYSGTLTANEIKNLYENKRYKAPVLNHNEQLGSELVTGFDGVPNGTDVHTLNLWDGTYGTPISTTIENERLKIVTNNVNEGAILYTPTSLGKRYKITVDYTGDGNGQVVFGNGGYGFITSNGIGFGYFVAALTYNLTYFQPNDNNGGTGYFYNISVREVLVNETKVILDVNAFDGVVRNKLSGNIADTEYVTVGDFTGYPNGIDPRGIGQWTEYNAVGTPDICIIEGGRIKLKTGIQGANGIKLSSPFYYTPNSIRKYRLQVEIEGNTTDGQLYIHGDQILYPVSEGLVIHDFIPQTGNYYGVYFIFPNGVYINNASIKEIIPSVIPTDVSVVKEGDVYSMRFNGFNSKINCGSYDPLIGDKTFVAWVKAISMGGGGYSIILNNAKTSVFNAGSYTIMVRSDGSTTAISDPIDRNKDKLIIVTRSSIGITNIYIDGVLNGTANQSSGIPVIGTDNINIGGGTVGFWDGLIPHIRIIDGILTPAEISQIYTSEVGKYS